MGTEKSDWPVIVLPEQIQVESGKPSLAPLAKGFVLWGATTIGAATLVYFGHGGAAAGLLSIVSVAAGGLAARRKLRSRDPDLAALLAPGAVRGRVVAIEPLTAPFCQRSCVSFRAEYVTPGKQTIAEETRDFEVVPLDGAAPVRVRGDDLRMMLSPRNRFGDRGGSNVIYLPIDDVVTVCGKAATEPYATGVSDGYRSPPVRTVLEQALVTNVDVNAMDRRARRLAAALASAPHVLFGLFVALLVFFLR